MFFHFIEELCFRFALNHPMHSQTFTARPSPRNHPPLLLTSQMKKAKHSSQLLTKYPLLELKSSENTTCKGKTKHLLKDTRPKPWQLEDREMVWVLLTRSTLTGQSPQARSCYHGYKNKWAYPQALHKQLVREKYVNISTVPCGECGNCQWAAPRTGSRKRQWPGSWRARDGTIGRAPAGETALRPGRDDIRKRACKGLQHWQRLEKPLHASKATAEVNWRGRRGSGLQ